MFAGFPLTFWLRMEPHDGFYARNALMAGNKGNKRVIGQPTHAVGRTMRLILSSVQFWPLIDSCGGSCVRSTESTIACTSVEMATDCLLASTAVAVRV